jgi:hypothetical protein
VANPAVRADDGGQRQHALADGAAVADEAAVGLLVELLGAGARGTRPWKPLMAPQAMVTNSSGIRLGVPAGTLC